jgi:quinol monooxygenase YgiN
VGILITHKVKDYDAWKPAFDAHEQGRKDAGLVAHALLRDPAKKSVSIWAGAYDLAKPQEMLGSEEMKQTMKDAGVIGKPTIMPMNIVAMSPPVEGAPTPTAGAIIDHKVKDFAAFKTVFDGAEQVRQDAGIVGWAVNQNPEDPNHVYVWVEAAEKEKLQAFLKSKELKDRMKEAGIKGAPKITQLDVVEWKMYQ